ncbi:transcriptional regulator with XRE-family HTH domain [Kitasatospora gansuensis]|uniref:Transcriptional regulator with XRE-family HTH domain n=1 Tax=Kitasatospora gansuensis TaxID=258050 RepID=A0A7W7SBN6_9ACTN|nr:tetratricopeptide repeat protein [Kitasatospora gansuensis]MBB4947493.1 transcriptional regulator with XRE-family HTH domain [Kitasatospora gansuensis]
MDSKTIGTRIGQLRRAAGMSQAELAGPNLSPSYISLLEAGKRTPSPEVLNQLVERLRCDPGELLELTEQVQVKEFELELRYAEMTRRNGDSQAALAAFEALQGKVTESEQPELWFAAETGIAQSLEHSGRLEEAVARYEALRKASDKSHDKVARLPIVVALCRCYRELGDLSHGIELAEATLAELERLNLTPTLLGVELLSTLVGIYCERGDLHRAAYLASTAIEQAQEVSNPRALGAAYWNASVVMHRNGRTADALDLIERALAIYSEGEDDRALARLRNAYAGVLLQLEQPDAEAAKELLTRSADILASSGSSIDVAYCETALARAELLLDNPGAAIAHADRALELLGSEHRLESARTLLVLAAARLAEGNDKAAQEAYERGALMLEASESGRQAAFAWAELAEILELCGHDERAVWAYRQSMRCLGRRGSLVTAPGKSLRR